MEKKKLERIIDIIREQMVTGSSAGFDPVMSFKRRKGPQIKLPPGSRKRWTQPK